VADALDPDISRAGVSASVPAQPRHPAPDIGVVWGLLLASGFNIRNALGFEVTYGLLGATAIIIAILGFFAGHRLRLALLVIAPVVFLNLDFLLTPPATLAEFFSRATYDLKALLPPLAFSLAGYVLGSLGRSVIRRSPTTA
jgi:hypothetical protein